jgi:hypothetical protein
MDLFQVLGSELASERFAQVPTSDLVALSPLELVGVDMPV